MTMLSLGDLAGTFVRRHQNARLKMRMEHLATEVTTGRTADPGRHLGGDVRQLSDIRHGLRLLEGYRLTGQEAALRSTAAQSALERVQEAAGDVAQRILAGVDPGSYASHRAISRQAEQAFATSVSALNARAGGVTLFSGADTTSAALAGAGTMLANLRAAIAGETTFAGFNATIDDWFDAPGGGFETLGYLGSDDLGPGLQIEDGITLSMDLRADDTVVRDTLKALAKAALAADAGLGFGPALVSDLVARAGDELLRAGDALTETRAALGALEEQVEDATVRNGARRAALQMAENDLLGVETYAAATELEEVQFRLESLYTITARLADLSLVRYVR